MNIRGLWHSGSAAIGLMILASTGTLDLPLSTATSPPSPILTISRNVIVTAFADAAPNGPEHAEGVVIWSHGRSLTREDSESATPLYLRSFVAAGWDVLRFNRPRAQDILEASTADLAARVHALKAEGYRKIVLAGQSYGGFIALGAARDNDDVHAVIATAPAAYGSFYDSYASWQENGEAFYRLLRGIDHKRVVLAFFHGDDYDPGGRGLVARQLLGEAGSPLLLIDQPRDLVGHLAANSGLFVRRYAACLVAFADAPVEAPAGTCDASWGMKPSAALLNIPTGLDSDTKRTGASQSGATLDGRWYGYYPNGREFVLEIPKCDGDQVTAYYGIGASVDGTSAAAWVKRKGQIRGNELVFTDQERSELIAEPTELGTMRVTWRAADGSNELDATARRID